MKKDKFKKYMLELIELKNAADDVSSALKKIDSDFNGFNLGRCETLIVDLLKDAMNDDSDWIGYWLYELDCGKKAKKDSVTIDNKNVPIKTIDDLYKILNENR